MSHRQFEAEPVQAVRWMLHIHQLVHEIQEQKRGPRGVGGA